MKSSTLEKLIIILSTWAILIGVMVLLGGKLDNTFLNR